jgi:DNA-binding CsgD family transcriptional regulator
MVRPTTYISAADRLVFGQAMLSSRVGDVMNSAVSLTAREAAVLRLLARGCTYVQVGDRLDVSVNTVATHVKKIYRKLEVRSARAAVWRAFELRLLGGAEDLHLVAMAPRFAGGVPEE